MAECGPLLRLLDPHLPDWLPEISLENLRIGNASVGLRFWRKPDGSTDYEVRNLEGALKVVRCSKASLHLSGWAEEIDEFTNSLG